MKYSRYDIRNACFKKRNGKEPKHPEIIDIIEPMMKEKNFAWQSFGKWWDVVVTRSGKLAVVPVVKDLPQVESVCSQMKVLAEIGASENKQWSDDEQLVIDFVEAQFLDGIMAWDNYNVEWGVRRNNDHDRIETYLIKRKPAQKIEVTQELIDKKLAEQMTASDHTTEEARGEVNTVQTTLTLGE